MSNLALKVNKKLKINPKYHFKNIKNRCELFDLPAASTAGRSRNYFLLNREARA